MLHPLELTCMVARQAHQGYQESPSHLIQFAEKKSHLALIISSRAAVNQNIMATQHNAGTVIILQACPVMAIQSPLKHSSRSFCS